MSLIADALKTAQREKERRESRDSLSSSAVLIPLREPRTRLDPRRLLAILALGVSAIVTWIALREGERVPSLPAAPAVAPTMISQAIAAPAPPREPPSSTPRREPVVASVRETRPAITVMRSAETPAVSQRRALSPGQTPETEQAGELRVAVEPRTNAAGVFAQAVAAHRAGDIASARILYDRVLSADPDHSDALNNLGVIYSGERQFERALELLRRASALAPRNAATWNNLGTALREQGRSDEAIAAFRQALDIDPAHLGARIGLSQQYLAIESFTEARQLLEQIVAQHPTHAEAHYTLGQVLERVGDRAGAVREYEMFVRVAPTRLASHAERVRLYLESLR